VWLFGSNCQTDKWGLGAFRHVARELDGNGKHYILVASLSVTIPGGGGSSNLSSMPINIGLLDSARSSTKMVKLQPKQIYTE